MGQKLLLTELRLSKIDAFHARQSELVGKMRDLLIKYKTHDLKIDPTTIATDIENSHVGKHLGARRFLEMLGERGINPQNFIAFGDSSSDFEMYDALKKAGKSAKFVFVGTKAGEEGENIQRTNSHFGEGTLEFLQSN